MRFHFENDEFEGLPEATPGPSKPADLDFQQRVDFLRLLHDGMGRAMACTQLGIETEDLRRLLVRNPAFRKAVEHVEQVRAENLFAGLYAAALKGDTAAARYLLAREDRRGRRGAKGAG